MRHVFFVFFVFLALFAVSCGREKMHEFNRLDQMRVLGLKADSPERAPGQSATITPLISDAKGGGRALTFSAVACEIPNAAIGEYPDCNGMNHVQFLAVNTAVTGLGAPNFTGATNTFTVTIPANYLSNRTQYEQAVGVPYLIVYTIRAADGTEVRAHKRITVSANPTQNQNPTLTAIQAGGATLTSLPGGSVALGPSYSSSSEETYTTITSTGAIGSAKEQLMTTWFVTEGTLDVTRTTGKETNGYSIGFRPAAPVVIMAVIRDNRGGEDFLKLEL